jgi:hypothetical protein
MAAGIPGSRAFAQLFAAKCSSGDEIPAEDRAALAEVGLRFVTAVVASNPEGAYGVLSTKGKQALPADRFLAIIRQSVEPMGPFGNLHVAQTHLVKITGGIGDQRVICGGLGRPEDWVAVAVESIPKQAYVLVEGETKNNGWAFVLWLVPEQDWRVQHFQFTSTEMVGKSAEDLWRLARDEQGRDHHFNATVLYQAAAQLAYRGPNFQLGIQPEIQREMAKLQPPPELQGQMPLTWQFGSSTFNVLHVGQIGVGGKIYLTIAHEILPWGQDAEADQRNHELIREFRRAFPEYSPVFAGLVVAAHEKGGTRGYRTVDAPTDQPN